MVPNVPIRLLTAFGKNNAGEVCGVTPDQAQRLIQSNHAVPVNTSEEVPATEGEPRVDKMEHGGQRRPRRGSTKAESDGN